MSTNKVCTFPPGHRAEQGEDGSLHVFRDDEEENGVGAESSVGGRKTGYSINTADAATRLRAQNAANSHFYSRGRR
jgi:hypothetical protein